MRVVLGRASHTPDKPEIRDPIVFVAFDKHNIAPLHTYNPIYNYNIKLKKYNPKAVFSTFFSIVKMEQVAKSGYSREGMENMKIAVAGTGYVGLSMAVLLSQHHRVTAVDIIQEKVDLINSKKSPIQDEYIEKFLMTI